MIPEVSLQDGHKLVDRVHTHLRMAILRGEMQPGTRLVETELAKRLGVSRSPVREAVSRLEHENLVVVSGLRVMVKEVPASEIEDLFWIRYALEGIAASLSTPKLTEKDFVAMRELCLAMEKALAQQDFVAISRLGEEFHMVFITACGNKKLHKMLSDVKAYIDRFRSVTAASPGRGVESVREHRAVLRAFEERDAGLAERLVRDHVAAARAVLLSDKAGAAIATSRPN